MSTPSLTSSVTIPLSAQLVSTATVLQARLVAAATDRFCDDHGEGVISTAIAVLIVAFLGAAAWLIFDGLLTSAGNGASQQVNNIGPRGA
jgi:hypothetical protein